MLSRPHHKRYPLGGHIPCLALVLLLGLTVLAGGGSVPIEDELFGIRLGSGVQDLTRAIPGLYRHRLAGGDVLYEACNQDRSEVFLFAEPPVTPDRITFMSVRIEPDVGVCRDETGSLPDLHLEPRTPRGVRLGDPRSAVVEHYGAPARTEPLEDGAERLEYPKDDRDHGAYANGVVLAFTIHDQRVTEISLRGDLPTAEVTVGFLHRMLSGPWPVSVATTFAGILLCLAPSTFLHRWARRRHPGHVWGIGLATFGGTVLPLSFWLYAQFFVGPLRALLFGFTGLFLLMFHLAPLGWVGGLPWPNIEGPSLSIEGIAGLSAFWAAAYGAVGLLIDVRRRRRA